MVRVSVIICTYNRCDLLNTTLETVAACSLPNSEWEVLVVDNNSTDQTREIVGGFSRRFPGRFRYTFEKQQGLSYARNKGVREARGEIVAFTDDDVLVERSWLRKLVEPLLVGEWAAVAGRVIPLWRCPRPAWVPTTGPYTRGVLVEFDRGSISRPLSEPPFGANMAFQRKIFEKYGDFRTDLGRSGTNLLSNEDTEFGHRLLRGGERFFYEPAAVVYHPVQEERISKRYFQRWWYGKAIADVKLNGVTESKFAFFGVPVHLFRRLIACSFRWITCTDPAARFAWKLNIYGLIGTITESYRWCHRGHSERAVLGPGMHDDSSTESKRSVEPSFGSPSR